MRRPRKLRDLKEAALPSSPKSSPKGKEVKKTKEMKENPRYRPLVRLADESLAPELLQKKYARIKTNRDMEKASPHRRNFHEEPAAIRLL